MRLIGIFRVRELRALVGLPRWTWHCRCGWYNVFRPLDEVDEAA